MKKITLLSIVCCLAVTSMFTACGKKQEVTNDNVEEMTAQESEEMLAEENLSKESEEKLENEAQKSNEKVEEETTTEKSDKKLADDNSETENDANNSEVVDTSEQSEETENAMVFADWAENVPTAEIVYDEYVQESSEWKTQVLFWVNGMVTDFKLLSVVLEDIDENGKMTFSEESVLYETDELTEDRLFLASITFYGDLPSYAISYKDGNGNTIKKAIEISGEDGSLLLREY